ncbi:MAG TPA: DUF2085 domain-containing protein [Methanomassiliicoccales archaeon]|nr:DUF2085 domain-containing protein [Methanomassiliicoccales archaeon]
MPIPSWSELRRSRKAEVTMLIVFAIWLLLVVIAPLSLPRDSVQDLSGTVGEIENGEQFDSMNPLAWVVYTIGDMYCHQISDRSLYLNENQMPLCSRDLGIFIGLVAGMLLAILLNIRISILLFILILVPMGIDGSLQLLTGYESSNLIRLITGLMAGTGVALIMSRLARQVLDVYDENPESIHP